MHCNDEQRTVHICTHNNLQCTARLTLWKECANQREMSIKYCCYHILERRKEYNLAPAPAASLSLLQNPSLPFLVSDNLWIEEF